PCLRQSPSSFAGRLMKSVDLGRVAVVAFAVSGVAAREEVDLVGEDLAAVALHALLVFPLGVVEPALDRDQLALGAELPDGLGEPVEAGHPVEFAVLGGVAVFILVGLAILVPRGAVGDDGDAGDGGSALGLAGFGI